MAYTTKQWAKVKADYLTGNYSVEKLSKKYEISEPAISNKAKAEGWIKGQLKEKIEKKVEESTIEILARIGCTPEFRLKLLHEGLLADRTYVKGEYVEVEADHNSRVKYHDIINKLTGSYTPEKVEHSGQISIADQIKQSWKEK